MAKKIMKTTVVVLISMCWGTMIFSASAENYNNGTYFSGKTIAYNKSANLSFGTKAYTEQYAGLVIGNPNPASVYAKVSFKENGSGVDQSNLIHVKYGNTPTRISYNYYISKGTNYYIRGVNKNASTISFYGTAYFN